MNSIIPKTDHRRGASSNSPRLLGNAGEEKDYCGCYEVERLESKLKKAKEACRKRKERGRHGDNDDGYVPACGIFIAHEKWVFVRRSVIFDSDPPPDEESCDTVEGVSSRKSNTTLAYTLKKIASYPTYITSGEYIPSEHFVPLPFPVSKRTEAT